MNSSSGTFAFAGLGIAAALAAGVASIGATGSAGAARYVGSPQDPALSGDVLGQTYIERLVNGHSHEHAHAHAGHAHAHSHDEPFTVQCGHIGVIFAAGTPWEYVEKVTRRIHDAYGAERFNPQGSTWYSGGSSGPLTYSFVPDGVSIPGFAGEPTSPNNLKATLDSKIGPGVWENLTDDAMEIWGSFSDLQYSRVSDDGAAFQSADGPLNGQSGRGDCRIAAHPVDGPSGILAYNFFPSGGGDMVLDSAENWGNSFNNFVFFRNVVSHENGHGIGLLHVCPSNQSKLMEPFASTSFDGPQLDDIRAATFLYGDRLEPNQGPSSAGNIGTLNIPSTTDLEDLSLRNGSDIDVVSFEVNGSIEVSARVRPVGFDYLERPEDSNCGSSSGSTTTSARNLIDPQIEILDENLNVVETVNDFGYGAQEQTGTVVFTDPGTYHIRVSAAASQGIAQLYDLRISIAEGPAGCPADFTGDGVVGVDDLSFLLGQWGASGGPAELDGNSPVGAVDLSILLGAWGPCPTD